jgi:hypothetical protein
MDGKDVHNDISSLNGDKHVPRIRMQTCMHTVADRHAARLRFRCNNTESNKEKIVRNKVQTWISISTGVGA